MEKLSIEEILELLEDKNLDVNTQSMLQDLYWEQLHYAMEQGTPLETVTLTNPDDFADISSGSFIF